MGTGFWLLGFLSPLSHLRPRRPEYRKKLFRQCLSEVVHAHRAHGGSSAIGGFHDSLACTRLGPDHALRHADVMLAPKREHLVIFDHGFAEDAQAVIATALVDFDDRSALGGVII